MRGGWAGVLGVVVPGAGLLVLPIWDFPGTDAGGTRVLAFAQDHQGALQVVMALNAVGVTLWMVLSACVWATLGRRRGGPDAATACFVVGAASYTSMLLAGFVCFDLVVYRLPDPSTSALLYDLTFGLLAMSGLPTAVSLGGYAVALRRHPVLPAWTGHLAAVAAAAHLLLLLSFVVPSGFLSLEGAVITVVPALLWAWVLAAGVALLRTDPDAVTQA